MNTATAKSVEQLRQEAEAAAKALAEAQEVEREKERQVKAEEARTKRDAEEKAKAEKMLKALRPVYDAMKVAGIACEMVGLSIRLKPDDIADMRVGVETEYGHSSSSWRQGAETGRFIITVGDTFRDMPRLRYPQHKNGGHNTEKIVKSVKERIEARAAVIKRNQTERQQKENAGGFAAKVVRDLKLKADTRLVVGNYETSHRDYRNRYSSTYTTAPEGKVFVRLGTYAVTPQQAAILIKAMRDCGFAVE